MEKLEKELLETKATENKKAQLKLVSQRWINLSVASPKILKN